jgi:monoterpene epsilon-lactone hydrolase
MGMLAVFSCIEPLRAQQESGGSTVDVRAFVMPYSNLASPAASVAFARLIATPGPKIESSLAVQRTYYGEFNDRLAERMKALYPVSITLETMNGVKTEIITPKAGVSPNNKGRVLINLHGGAFLWGEGSGGEVEAIPIAASGKIKVVTVFYRQGPENKFPAASQDVASVYKALLKTYKAQNIGIYGCSAGGVLAAESIAWFAQSHLPRPGAVGTFCGSTSDLEGDSSYFAPALSGAPSTSSPLLLRSLPYFIGADPHSPLVFPINSESVLSRFPPTLLLSGSRDFALSSVLHSHAELSRLGVDAELHVWEGMWHSFFVDPDLPESKEVYAVIVSFFDRHLGRD